MLRRFFVSPAHAAARRNASRIFAIAAGAVAGSGSVVLALTTPVLTSAVAAAAASSSKPTSKSTSAAKAAVRGGGASPPRHGQAPAEPPKESARVKIQQASAHRAPVVEITDATGKSAPSEPAEPTDNSSSGGGNDPSLAGSSGNNNTAATAEASTPEAVTSFLSQFQYAAPELSLRVAPPDMAVELLDYQKEGVGWMVRREHYYSGGIMADFLGMGKTVQMLALCLARQTARGDAKQKAAVDKAVEATQSKVDSLTAAHGEPHRILTVLQQLVTIPVVLNVSRITQPGRDLIGLQKDIMAVISGGESAGGDGGDFGGNLFDVAGKGGASGLNEAPALSATATATATAASAVQQAAAAAPPQPRMSEAEAREAVAAVMKELDKWLTFAGKYYASWEKRARSFIAQRETGAGGAADGNMADLDTPELRTLIIVPASLVFQWKSEIDTKINADRGISAFIYHGASVKSADSPLDLEQHDFVITTFETVVRGALGAFMKSEVGASKRNARAGSAHHHESMGSAIFNRAAASALFRVRWKRIILDEAHYMRNQGTTRYKCIRQLLGLKRWAVTATPLHNSIQDLQTLLTFVGQPRLPLFEANESQLLKDPVLQRAIARSLQPAFLRRTPVMTRGGRETTLLVLPTKDDNVVRGELTEKEVDNYNTALSTRQQALTAIKDKSIVHVFAMMTLLRQACCHPWMTEGRKLDSQVCFLCNLEVFAPVITRCGHAFCRECLHMAFRSHGGDGAVRLPCPACEVPIPLSIFTTTSRGSSADNIKEYRKKKWETSSKIDMLMDAIANIIAKNADEKLVVFAQFTQLLDILAVALERNFPDTLYVRIDGSIQIKMRNGLIHAFSADPKVKILLASKMAMGVGLNLTAANHVIIMDPWWNPQVEEQAVHRCHRIGQKKHVNVMRFVMTDTIEQYCYEISRKKKDFGDAVLKAATAEEDDHEAAARSVAQQVEKQLKPIVARKPLPQRSVAVSAVTMEMAQSAKPLPADAAAPRSP